MSTIAKLKEKSKRSCGDLFGRPAAGLELENIDTRVAVIQALIPLGLSAVSQVLEAEVRQSAGERYQRRGRLPGLVRWTPQRGSIWLGDQKIPIQCPRVRDRANNVEAPFPTYQALQQPRGMDEGLLRRVLLGLSCGRYREAAEAAPEALGLSRSSVSRRMR